VFGTTSSEGFLVFTARRYASAVFAVVICPSVRLSVRPTQAGIVSKRLDESSCFFGLETSFHLSHTVLWGNLGISKSDGTSDWNLVPNSALRKFRRGKSIASSTKVVVHGRACWRHLYDNRWVVAVYCKSVSCNPLTTLLRFVVDSLCNLFLRLTRFWLTWRVARSVCDSRASCKGNESVPKIIINDTVNFCS